MGGYRSHRPLLDAPTDQMPALIDQIAQEASQHSCDRILISSEEFIHSRYDQEQPLTLIEFLNQRFGAQNVTLIYLLRDHVSFMESTYAQHIKGGMFRVRDNKLFAQHRFDLEGFADQFKQTHGFEIFSYSDFFTRFEGRKAGNNIEYFSIHREDNAGKDIIETLCDFIGVSKIEESQRKNSRMSEQALFHILHARKRHGIRKVKPRRNILAKVFSDDEAFRSPLFRMTPALHQRIEAAAVTDRDFLAKHSPRKLDKMLQVSDRDFTVVDGPITPPDAVLELIDYIVTSDEMTVEKARKAVPKYNE
ncbi:hypothetical protein H4P12_10705 [Paracoccus sp. 11-3]|uniref:Uncharacterized protein n=2 Tax=Paracoccus amoyensis TaxID=2760093 RepID=A0A926J6F0_9RHOB|nr:hypothetical protein [Paracoccus amoyensis]